MEAVIRHLRDGRVKEYERACPVAILCDDTGCPGGTDLMTRLVADYRAAFEKGTCQAGRVDLLMLDGSLGWAQEKASPAATVLDGCSDPAGWLKDAGAQSGAAGQRVLHTAEPGALQDILAAVTRADSQAAGSSAAQLLVMIDNLSPLFLYHPADKVLAFLEQLRSQPHISGVLAAVHEDVVGSRVAAAIERQASCWMRVQPVSDLQRDLLLQSTGRYAHGYLHCSFKSRKAGRLRTEGAFYSIARTGGATFLAAPPQLRDLTSEMLVAIKMKQEASRQASGANPASAGGTAAKGAPAAAAVTGSMKLTLTDKERQAKEAVVLPYEHGGAGQTTGDWKDYLPTIAGGRAAGVHGQAAAAAAHTAGDPAGAQEPKLGHIHYVRDSDDENGGLHDSDEDPDDDLDI